MNELFNYVKEIKEKEGLKITCFAPIENNVFINLQYFTIEKNGLFFYIENRCFGGYELTTYKKINFNKRQQLFYPVNFYDKQQLLQIINEHIEKAKIHKPFKDAPIQTIYWDLLTYYNFNNKYQTLWKHLQDIAGFREKEILQKIDFVEMKQNDKNYCVLEFYNTTGQAFAINTKNINRLIIS